MRWDRRGPEQAPSLALTAPSGAPVILHLGSCRWRVTPLWFHHGAYKDPLASSALSLDPLHPPPQRPWSACIPRNMITLVVWKPCNSNFGDFLFNFSQRITWSSMGWENSTILLRLMKAFQNPHWVPSICKQSCFSEFLKSWHQGDTRKYKYPSVRTQ